VPIAARNLKNKKVTDLVDDSAEYEKCSRDRQKAPEHPHAGTSFSGSEAGEGSVAS